MDKQSFKLLRWTVESDVRRYVEDEAVVEKLASDIMRSLLSEISAQAVKRQKNKRDFLTFRRNPDVTVPGWAYRKPGIAPGFPTLR